LGNRNIDVEKRDAEKTMIDLYARICFPKCESVWPDLWTVNSVGLVMGKFVNDDRNFGCLTSFLHAMFRSVSLRWKTKVFCTKPNFPALI